MNKHELLLKITNYIVKRLREFAPKDTRNLAYNAIIGLKVTENKSDISVSLKIAPYMPYTNEPWISPKWNGKQNPNEYWWNDAIVLILHEVAQIYGGKLVNVKTE
jgi:hypothetical protein